MELFDQPQNNQCVTIIVFRALSTEGFWPMSSVRATTCWSTRKSSGRAMGTLTRSIPSTRAGWSNSEQRNGKHANISADYGNEQSGVDRDGKAQNLRLFILTESCIGHFGFHRHNSPCYRHPQGLRTTFPWVFWGFHEKYKTFI